MPQHSTPILPTLHPMRPPWSKSGPTTRYTLPYTSTHRFTFNLVCSGVPCILPAWSKKGALRVTERGVPHKIEEMGVSSVSKNRCVPLWEGMVDVRTKRCGYPGCSTQPTFGVTGSKKPESGRNHAMAGTNGGRRLKSKRCGYPGYLKHPNFCMVGDTKVEVCRDDAEEKT